MTNKLKEHTGFHYLLTEMQLYTFWIEYIPHNLLNKIRDKSISHNMFRIKDNESIMCGFYCIAFIDYMLSGKTLVDIPTYFLQMTMKRMRK